MTETQLEAAAERVLSGRSGTRSSKRAIITTAATDGQRILTYRDVAAITSYHVATIYRKVIDPKDDFPRPVRLSTNRVGFREADIARWLAARGVA